MRKMHRMLALLLAAALLVATTAAADTGYRIAEGNDLRFGELLYRLKKAYRNPSEDDGAKIEGLLEVIRGENPDDGDVAQAIADHWKKVYLDPDYALYLYRGEKTAVTLERSDPAIGERHAIVVLGYQLENGEMRDELKGRCKAAAAAARSWPGAILVCSGGATGSNNPHQHTEAGMMKDYLVKKCGIDANRIYTDEEAMSTLENAENTFAILREQDIQTITIVTSTYHQKWGQVLYNAMSALYEKRLGYGAEIVGNYCFSIEPEEEAYRKGYNIALTQLASMLELSKEARDIIRKGP